MPMNSRILRSIRKTPARSTLAAAAALIALLAAVLFTTPPVNAQDRAVTVSFARDAYLVAESDNVAVTVRLSRDPQRQVIIPIESENRGGVSDADYSTLPTSVTFQQRGDLQDDHLYRHRRHGG